MKLDKKMVKVHNESMKCVSYLIKEKGLTPTESTDMVLEMLKEIFDSPYPQSPELVCKLLRMSIIE